jgi:hypothetical protein
MLQCNTNSRNTKFGSISSHYISNEYYFFPPKQVAKWDTKAINLLAYKLRENRFIGSNYWCFLYKYYGYNLFKLKDL